MKRGKGKHRDRPLQVVTTTQTAKKKGKGVVCKAKEVTEKPAEELKPAAVEVLTPGELEEWAGLWSEADEEMTWGTFWSPYWEMMVLGMGVGEAYDAGLLYSEVLWGYDIWNLEAIGNAPNP